MTSRFLLLFILTACAAHGAVGDLFINYQTNSSGKLTELQWSKVNSQIWGVDSTGTVKGFGLGSGLALSGDTTLTVNGSTGGNGSADSAKAVQFQGNGEITATSTLTVVQLLGFSHGYGQLQHDNLTFNNIGGTAGRFYTLALPALSGSRYIYLPSLAGTIARLEDITLSQLPQTGATSGQSIVWNGSAWAPATISSGITVGTTTANGTAGNVLYTDGSKVQQYTVVPSTEGGTGVANNGTITNASNTTITGGGTLALGGFTATIPATGTVALLGTSNTFTASGSSGVSAMLFTGSPFAGTSTTSKPLVLLEQTGATSSGWSSSGAMLGVNAASGFNGMLLDLQSNGVRYAGASMSQFYVRATEMRLAYSTPLLFGPSSTVDIGISRISGSILAVAGVGGATEWRVIGDNGGGASGVYASFGHNGTNGVITTGSSGGRLVLNTQTNTVQLGTDVDANAPDQTMRAASGVTGINRDGGDFNLASGDSTGSGTSAIIFSAPAAGSSGTTARTATERARISSVGFQVGKLILWSDATTAPTADPPAGFFYFYVDPADGALKARGASGTITTIAAP